MTLLHLHLCVSALACWSAHRSGALGLPGAPAPLRPLPRGAAAGPAPGLGLPRARRRRAVSPRDVRALLDFHNQVRAQVSPPAANMEYMVWDERLAQAADAWAARCLWEHGPPQLMKFVGQNLSIHSGRFRSVVELVKSWYHEKQHYSFPQPGQCRPRCPATCSASVCSHYTQMVWETSSRLGCALRSCANMRVWGSTWRRAEFLVCNYAVKGNWIGEAPYKVGRPCSACPPSYGGACSDNMCVAGLTSNQVG